VSGFSSPFESPFSTKFADRPAQPAARKAQPVSGKAEPVNGNSEPPVRRKPGRPRVLTDEQRREKNRQYVAAWRARKRAGA
jgi:hypothetical protein